jgi:diguanylate cyclase (GGDEF)-like protein
VPRIVVDRQGALALRVPRWLLVVLGLTGAVPAMYVAAPHGLRLALPIVSCAAATVACLRVTRARPPPVLRVWYAMAASMATFGAFFVLASVGAPTAVGNAVMGVAYLPAAYVTWQIAPRGMSGRAAAWFDLPIILGATGLVAWQLFLQPYRAGLATTGGLGAALQPAVALLLLSVMVRSLLSGSRRLPSYSLLLFAAVFSLLADVVLSYQALRGAGRPGKVADVLPLLAQLMVLAAALHPRAALLGRPALRRRHSAAQTMWLAPVGMVVVTLPWITEALGLSGELLLPGLAGVAIINLVVARCVLLVARADRLVATDLLTGLASRRAFLARLGEAADLPQGVALLVVDLDNFKAVNDSTGHAAGDALLVQLSARLRRVLQPGNLAARIGGDEFAALLPEVADTVSALSTGRRLADALSQPFLLGGVLHRLTVSIGVVPPLPGVNGEGMLAAADMALYVAKANGPGRVDVYSEEVQVEVHDLRRRAAELVAAIAAGPTGPIEVHYQPVLELRGRTLCAAEALIRWRHPDEGLLTAFAFLHLVETPQLALDLDALVLRVVARQIAQWRDSGISLGHVPVAVNLSAATLLRPDLVDLVTDALTAVGVPAEQLILEITEHEAVPEESAVEEALRSLAAAGVTIWLDDFGVGYTSLRYLERFPITTLKADKSLTATALTPRASPLLGGVVALGRSAEVTALAEGVETEEQAQRLLALGFQLGQGYHLGRPMPAAQLEAWEPEAGHGLVPEQANGQLLENRPLPSDDVRAGTTAVSSPSRPTPGRFRG